jgi:hypothetical protein
MFICGTLRPKNYEARVPVEIHHSNGVEKMNINQQRDGGKWNKVGTYEFDAGHRLALTIIGEQGKYTIADAVRFEFAE